MLSRQGDEGTRPTPEPHFLTITVFLTIIWIKNKLIYLYVP